MEIKENGAFSTHYKKLDKVDTLGKTREHRIETLNSCVHEPRQNTESPVRSGREIHLEIAVEEAQKMIAQLTHQLDYVQTELDIKIEEVCSLPKVYI